MVSRMAACACGRAVVNLHEMHLASWCRRARGCRKSDCLSGRRGWPVVSYGLARPGILEACRVCMRPRAAVRDYFAWATTTTMSHYHESADEVPEGMSIPRWSWDGLQH